MRAVRIAWLVLPPAIFLFAVAEVSGGCSSNSASPSRDAGSDATADALAADAGATDAAGPDVNADVVDPLVVAINQFCDQAFGAEQSALDACCSAADKQTNEYGDVSAFLMQGAQTCTVELTQSVVSMRATFDMNATAACIQQIQATWGTKACWPQIALNRPAPLTFASSDCSGVMAGKQGSGMPCDNDLECLDGLSCVGETTSQAGVCKPPGAMGAACGAGNCAVDCVSEWGFGSHPACGSGLYCADTCQPQIPAGQSCSDTPGACANGLVCAGSKCSAAYAGDGGACASLAECQDGLTCVAQGDSGVETCVPKGAQGAPCSADDQCQGYCEVDDAGGSSGAMNGSCATLCGSN
jgi:hypothetical protein